MKIKQILFAAAAMMLAVACGEKPEEPQTPNEPNTPEEPSTPEVVFTVNPTSLAFTAEGGSQSVTLVANGEWAVEFEGDWLSLGEYDDTASEDKVLPIVAAANTETEPREGRVIFSLGEKSAEVAVTQAAAEESAPLGFYISPEAGYAGYSYKPLNLLSKYSVPGHQITLVAGLDMAVLTILDYDYEQAGCSTYTYITAKNYPLVEGDSENFPTTSCLLVNNKMTYFIIGGVYYYPVVPENSTDEKGRPYGFNMLWTAMPYSDINVCEIYLPAVDENGKQVIIDGGFSGVMEYEVSIPPTSFNLKTFGFNNFVAEAGEGNVVTLTSTSLNGDFQFVLTTADGTYATPEGVSYSVEGGTLSGSFIDSETFAKYTFTGGAITLKSPAAEGEPYTLRVDGAVGFAAPGLANTYEIVAGEYPIAIE